MKRMVSMLVGKVTSLGGMAVLSGFSAAALAFQPMITDDTGTQGKGGNQIEFSQTHDRKQVSGETERTDTSAAVFTRGLSETLDVFVGASHARIRASAPASNINGNGNSSLGAKWRFYENEADGTSIAIRPEIILPVSSGRESSGLGTGRTSGNLTMILTQETPFGAIHVNAGVGRDRFRNTDDNPDTTYRRASLAPVWDVSESWKLALDMGVEYARAAGNTVHSRFFEVGAIYSPNKDLDVAVGLIRNANNESPRATTHSVTAGVTLRF